MTARNAWRWITGGHKPAPPCMPGFISYAQLSDGWSLRFAGGMGLSIRHSEAPNFIHRTMQRLLLGIRWEML